MYYAQQIDHDNCKVSVFSGKMPRPVISNYDRRAYKAAQKGAKEAIEKKRAYDEQVKNELGIEFTAKYIGYKKDKDFSGDSWRINGKGDFELTWTAGVGHRFAWNEYGLQKESNAVIVPPSAMDILYCCLLDDPQDMSFEFWCDCFGYDTDSRKAESIYRACIEQTMMFRRNYPSVNLQEYEPLKNF